MTKNKDKISPLVEFSRTADKGLEHIFKKLNQRGIDSLDRIELTYIARAFCGKILDSVNGDKDIAYELLDIVFDNDIVLNNAQRNEESNLIVALKEIKKKYIKYVK